MGEKGGRYVGLQTYHHPVPLSLNLGTLSSWNPPDNSRPAMGLIYSYVEFTFSCRVSLTVHAASEILAFSIILCEVLSVVCAAAVAYPGIFLVGVQQIHLRTENRPLPLPLHFTKKDAIRVLLFFSPGSKLW